MGNKIQPHSSTSTKESFDLLKIKKESQEFINKFIKNKNQELSLISNIPNITLDQEDIPFNKLSIKTLQTISEQSGLWQNFIKNNSDVEVNQDQLQIRNITHNITKAKSLVSEWGSIKNKIANQITTLSKENSFLGFSPIDTHNIEGVITTFSDVELQYEVIVSMVQNKEFINKLVYQFNQEVLKQYLIQ